MYILLIFLLLPLASFASERLALVSVAPYVELVDELTEKQVTVQLLVPPGFSSHTYEPTPKEIINATKASIWFTIGELFEERVERALKSENPKLVTVDLRQGLSLMGGHTHEGSDHICSQDTHIWMSPKMMMQQVKHMAKSLGSVFPEIKDTVDKNEPLVLAKLEKLDTEIRHILAPYKGKTIFVSHPAYGYFCREYDLHEESIEFEGKDPTPKQLYNLINEAKEDKVETIFIQKQYSTKAADLIAKEIGAKLILLDPYSEHYFDSMLLIAKSIAEASK